jgi:hypothetical protein
MKARRCVICGRYFSPYSRKTDEQVLCGRRECRLRKRQEWEHDWWRSNPECLPERKRKTGIWAKERDYWRQNRVKNPEYTARNREQTRERMRRRRAAQAKYVLPLKNPIEYLKGLKCPKPGLPAEMFAKQDSLRHISRRGKPLRHRVFAKQDSLNSRLDGVCNFLIGREMFAKQDYPDRSVSKIVKLGNGGDSS